VFLIEFDVQHLFSFILTWIRVIRAAMLSSLNSMKLTQC